MSPTTTERRARVLDPMSRVSEVLFGLIMVLTFTGSLSVATAGHAEVREMLVGALGCNFAWGVIDAMLYLLGVLAEKGHGLAALRALQRTSDAQKARSIVADALPPLVASVLEPSELDRVRERLLRLPEPPQAARLQGEDWKAAFAICLLVFLSTLPVAVPFVLMQEAHTALRVSNAIAITMLFFCGYAVGRMTGHPPWIAGIGMVFLGSAVVAMTMSLGG
jgi:VIT1/CCC1 family predicted Fe2+/Mn2+ transporter